MIKFNWNIFLNINCVLLTQTHPSFSYQFLSSSQSSSNFVDVAVSGIYHGVD